MLGKPLAIEEVKDMDMWNHLARIAVENEHEVPANEYFRSYADLSWAMSKVGYDGQTYWTFIENLFETELARLRADKKELDE